MHNEDEENEDFWNELPTLSPQTKLVILRNQGRGYIAPISGYAQLLAKSETLSPDEKQYVARIVACIQQLDKLVEALT